jgi:hypothetical protein
VEGKPLIEWPKLNRLRPRLPKEPAHCINYPITIQPMQMRTTATAETYNMAGLSKGLGITLGQGMGMIWPTAMGMKRTAATLTLGQLNAQLKGRTQAYKCQLRLVIHQGRDAAKKKRWSLWLDSSSQRHRGWRRQQPKRVPPGSWYELEA